jgi:hypothetical protein
MFRRYRKYVALSVLLSGTAATYEFLAGRINRPFANCLLFRKRCETAYPNDWEHFSARCMFLSMCADE